MKVKFAVRRSTSCTSTGDSVARGCTFPVVRERMCIEISIRALCALGLERGEDIAVLDMCNSPKNRLCNEDEKILSGIQCEVSQGGVQVERPHVLLDAAVMRRKAAKHQAAAARMGGLDQYAAIEFI